MENNKTDKIVLPDETLSGLWTNPDGPLMVTQHESYVQLSDGIGTFEQDGWIHALFPGEWQGKVRPIDNLNTLLWDDDGGTWNRLRDLTGMWLTPTGTVQLGQLDNKVIGKNISGTIEQRSLNLLLDGMPHTGELSFNDQFIIWQDDTIWERIFDTNGLWVVVQNQPKIDNIPGTGVQKGTQVALKQDENGIVSSKIIGVENDFSVNGRFTENDITITGNFPFNLGLGWLEYTLMSLQWHANRFNRIMDLTGQWECNDQTHTIKQITPDPIKAPAIGSLTIDGTEQGSINRTWVTHGEINGMATLAADIIYFDNGDCWNKVTS